ncbi:hypothetical protein M2350_002232 [Candidatus Fervidibacter sacchari]|uniref:Uncharacterized protein n=1 Tax=Candidatus Fervidibacter sacchari TaxID=1448929 RepID=A0ABT2EPN4_9BACT|nr:hypothetical protein [Candidatus Fervidibacter sacchari]
MKTVFTTIIYGYNSGAGPCHNTAWIYNGMLG